MSEALLQRVAAGDQAALVQLHERYRALVWSLVRRFCFEPSDAEDAVQEIFVDLWRSSHRFEPSVASEATFVAMIARRRLIDRRRRAARALPTTAMASEATREAPDGSVLRRSEIAELARQAEQAMGALRPEQQRVLRLSLQQGLSHERIAEATGLPLGTVKTHARRGLIRLREMLGSEVPAEQAGA